MKSLFYKKLNLLFISLIISNLCFSQKNFQPGYLLNLNGDSIKGMVDYRNWAINPKYVIFKTSDESSMKAYKPTDIREFGVKGEIYVSSVVKTEFSSNQTISLEDNPYFNFKTDTVFLQTILKGEKSLYYLRTEDKDNFYIKQGNQFELLEYKKYIKEVSERKVIVENKRFVGQLTIYLNDCPLITNYLKETSYKLNKLDKLFEKYYLCTKTEASFKKQKDKMKTEFGILAGASVTEFKVQQKGDLYDYLVKTNLSKSTDYTFGIFFNIIQPRYNGKWSINNELIYTKFNITSSDYVISDPMIGYKEVNTCKIGYNYLQMNNLVRFKYPFKKFRIFINAGISNAYALKMVNERKMVFGISTKQVKYFEAMKDPRKFEFGYIYGAGIDYKRFSLEFKQEIGKGTSDSGALDDKTIRNYVLLGYKLIK